MYKDLDEQLAFYPFDFPSLIHSNCCARARVTVVSIMQSALDSCCTEIPLGCLGKLIVCDRSIKSLHRCVFP